MVMRAAIPALTVGPHQVDPPVVLAPMAGVTNAAFRTLCRERAEAARTAVPARNGTAPAPAVGLYVCEMITSRGLVEGDESTRRMLAFDPGETVRSVQLYGVDPRVVGEATRILCDEYAVRHVDLNFGCPVPKVTRKGGGAVLPWKRGLLDAILRAAVEGARPFGVPVTMKTRKGIDDDHLTYLDAGRIAEQAGCAAIALHGRTAAQHYSGKADWDAIGALVTHVDIPVLGNGDIWEAADAVRMVEHTGCAGVVVGRGCLGRPWLFGDLATVFSGRTTTALPALGEVSRVMRRHVGLLVEDMGEDRACREFRKHVSWYLKGFAVRQQLRSALALVSSLAELDGLLAELDAEQPFPLAALGLPRGRQGSPRPVTLPAGWLSDRDGVGADLAGAELAISGG
jgi:nifR3 family TIM-barrel protein